MDKTVVQGRRTATARGEEAPTPGRADGASTRASILRAARDRLVEVGYANLNVRDIAREAGVNHALIGYHFHGKQQLVLAVLDEANRQLLDRQARMYQGTQSASEQWQQACDFYEEDLKSGFVRLLMELMGASFHDLELRREFVPRLSHWHRLVEAAVVAFIEREKLELPVSAQAISAGIVWFWTGLEASMMLGISEKDGHQREALAAMAALLRRVEGRAAAPTPRRRK
ncbi:MAG TPA: helix-turn-helix domain-containing protein [Caldimonas sp.]|nr:helix-turn-helix domain-containing protein [Caldimonas sp.]